MARQTAAQKSQPTTAGICGRQTGKDTPYAATSPTEEAMASPPGSGRTAVYQSVATSGPAASYVMDQQPTQSGLAPGCGPGVENPWSRLNKLMANQCFTNTGRKSPQYLTIMKENKYKLNECNVNNTLYWNSKVTLEQITSRPYGFMKLKMV